MCLQIKRFIFLIISFGISNSFAQYKRTFFFYDNSIIEAFNNGDFQDMKVVEEKRRSFCSKYNFGKNPVNTDYYILSIDTLNEDSISTATILYLSTEKEEIGVFISAFDIYRNKNLDAVSLFTYSKKSQKVLNVSVKYKMNEIYTVTRFEDPDLMKIRFDRNYFIWESIDYPYEVSFFNFDIGEAGFFNFMEGF